MIPDASKRGIIIKLQKKGNLSEWNDWRGIISQSINSKVFCRIILQRITTAADKLLRQERAGLRKGKSCIDHIFVLRQVLQQPQEWKSSLYVVFVNFEKAFNSLHRPSLRKILRHHGIPHKSVNIIQALYEHFECRVIHNNQLTEPFRVDTGVKQERILSPVLFSMVVDWLMRTVPQGRRLGIRWTPMTVLEDEDYADDIGLLSSKQQDAQQKAERLNKTTCTIGLKVNTKMTQVLRKNTRVNDPVMIDGTHLKHVEEFTYLATKVTTTGDCDRELNTRISKANQAFAMLKHVWRAINLSVHTKIKISRNNVLSVLLHGAKCWKTTATIQQKLVTFQTKCF